MLKPTSTVCNLDQEENDFIEEIIKMDSKIANEVEIKQMISSWEILEKQKFYEFCKCNLEKEKNIMCKIILLDYINLTEEKKIKKLKLSFLSKKISGFEVLNMISIIAFQRFIFLSFYVADIY